MPVALIVYSRKKEPFKTRTTLIEVDDITESMHIIKNLPCKEPWYVSTCRFYDCDIRCCTEGPGLWGISYKDIFGLEN